MPNPTLSPVVCTSCGTVRQLKHPKLAGKMCRPCAALIATDAATEANTSETLEKFNRYVNRTSTCWQWTGYTYGNGYAAITHDKRQALAHRWSYENFVGPIPEGLQLDHLCRNRSCVNPDHLEPVTARENTRRAMRSHCINGHEFTDANTYMYSGKRYCRECRRARNRASYSRRNAL